MPRWRSAKAERAHLIDVMRAGGRTWVEIAQDFCERYSVNARVAIRLAHGWSQADVAKEWCSRWPHDPRTDQNLSTWERWPESGHAPSLGTLIRLAEVYQCDLADLVADLGCYGHLDDIGTEPARVVHVRANKIPEPRNRLGAVNGQLPPVDYENAYVVNPLVLHPAASPDGATGSDVTAIRAMSDAFRAADRRLGGGVLFGSVTRYLNAEVAPLLLTSTNQERDTELFMAAASLTEAAGWMAHDGGRDSLARLHFTRAFKLASVAESGALMANVCASMSHLASQLGEVHEAVRLADKGLQHAAHKPLGAQLVARLHAMRALAFAGQHEPRASMAALARAEDALTAGGGRDMAWVSHFDEGSLASEAAMCLRWLGDADQAEVHARRAIELRSGDRVRSRTFAQITLARILAGADRVDEAASIGTTLCEIAGGLASVRVVHQLDGLGQVLARHGSVQEVAEFQEALADLHRSDPTTDQPIPWPI